MRTIALTIALLSFFAVGAAHLVGGEITYQCTGNNTYLIKLKVYRDCNSAGAPFDPNAYIAIFNAASGVEFTSVSPSFTSIVQLPATVNNPCLQTPPNICTEMATYSASVYLPPSNAGYVITYQRCCRNQTISNIPNPGTWGNTYTIRIPPNDVGCNSSPEFLNNPPIVLCANDALSINSAATEADGDSLYYELCNPLNGGSQTAPMPVPPTPPPYFFVPFSGGFSATNPMPANPAFQINPQTGLITGTPTTLGQYVVGICVSEYRNGVFLSKVLRDYQFNVTNCQANVDAIFGVNANFFADTIKFCEGTTVSFTNTSFNGTVFQWNFGDPYTNADTSSIKSPTYTYIDTGFFNVALIVNPGWACSDTAIKTIEVRHPANASFVYAGSPCFNSGGITFTKTSINTPKDTYYWDFGSDASPANSTLASPPPVVFTTPGQHVVSLTVDSYGCTKTVFDTVTVYLQPEIYFDVPEQTGCVPFTVTFQDSSIATASIFYLWDFGDGDTSTLANPVHTYQNVGVYDVSLTIYVNVGCTDTITLFKPGLITVNPTPTAIVDIWPIETTIYEPLVQVVDKNTQPSEGFYTDMGDGRVYNNVPHIYHQYQDTGTYTVTHVVYNGYNCADTIKTDVVISAVPSIFAPTAFTPDGDGINEIYKPSIIGAAEYRIYIYNRWGQIVFTTTDPYVGWNGLLNNTGAPMPIGVYTFAIYVRDKNNNFVEKKGYISLIR